MGVSSIASSEELVVIGDSSSEPLVSNPGEEGLGEEWSSCVSLGFEGCSAEARRCVEDAAFGLAIQGSFEGTDLNLTSGASQTLFASSEVQGSLEVVERKDEAEQSQTSLRAVSAISAGNLGVMEQVDRADQCQRNVQRTVNLSCWSFLKRSCWCQ